ncbi:MAG: ATP-binding protein [Chitinophagales bacterium]
MEYYQKVLTSSLASKAENIFNAFINVGVALQSLGRYQEAVKYYQKSLQIMGDNERYIDRKAACFENFGETRLAQKKYKDALLYLNKALHFNAELKQFKRIAVCLRLIGKAHLAQQKYEEAYEMLQKSLFYTREYSFVIEEKETLLTLIQYHKETKQWEDCIECQGQLIELQDKYFYPEKKEEVQAILGKKEDELDVLMERNLQIEQQNQQLQQYNRELKQYAFIVAHDLKEPLCNISGFTTLLTNRHKENLSEEALEFLNYIEGGAQYMHSLLEDLLQYSTLQLQEEKIVTLNTNQHLQKVLATLQTQINEVKATIQVSELPQLDIEPKHFQWLMVQILGNALKFSHPDKPCNVLIHSYKKKGKQYIEVRDNGIGIESIQQQKIFRIFQRLHKQNYEGTGIGLAICRKIIDMYGGEIGLQSKVGEGTAFHFSLPTVVIP